MFKLVNKDENSQYKCNIVETIFTKELIQLDEISQKLLTKLKLKLRPE